MDRKKKIDQIGIAIKPHAPGIEKILKEIMSYLEREGINCLLEEAAACKMNLPGGYRREDLAALSQAIIVLGGDGTLLSVAASAARAGVPVIGLNLGRLGFLTEIPVDEAFPVLEAFLKDDEWLHQPADSDLRLTYKDQADLCLNDVVLNKGALARMIEMLIYINGQEVTRLKR